ncbi:MAG TPA: ATP-binding cassette domain-containing protein [Steroidobacteraceae bacterium]|jgi:ABC-type transport system involved in Fe-S cluster assembly fused permease/ATPase subunit|nr:ATP-binding cassette domain-containing protein [Steroidobacteraceae bacterium]
MRQPLSDRFQSVKAALALIWLHTDRFVKVRLFLAVSSLVLASVFTALGPLALKNVVDAIAGDRTGTEVSITVLVILYVLTQWLARGTGELRALLYAYAERRLFRTLSEKLFAHVMRLPLRFHLGRQTGAIGQTLQNGLEGYQLILHHLVFTFLPVVAELATIVIVLVRLDQPIFFAFYAGASLCYAIVFGVTVSRVMKTANAASATSIDASATMTDSILNYETVKYFAAERVVQEKVSRALRKTEREWVSFYRLYSMSGLAVATTYAAFLALTILYAVKQVQVGAMTIGGFVLVNTYMLQIIRPIEMLGYAVQGFSQGIAMLDSMLKLLQERPESDDAAATVATTGPGSLEFDSVSVSYRSDRTILDGVSFRIPAGKTLGIVGTSGAGKSTIVRLVTRLLEADSGRILLDGMPIAQMPLSAVRQAIAVVPQDTVLFNDTIGYNIAFGKEGCTQQEIEEAARLAHLHEFIVSLPDGYETPVGERGVKLSGGEKQRVSIARAALKHPRIYVFDEATSSLDSKTERQILHNLREISSEQTTLVIAHRLSTVVHADEIVVLEHGTIVERGTHASLIEQNNRYAALWRAQQAASPLGPAMQTVVVVENGNVPSS